VLQDGDGGPGRWLLQINSNRFHCLLKTLPTMGDAIWVSGWTFRHGY
jgi:hypothetical protein